MGYEICVLTADKKYSDGSLDLPIDADMATSVRIEETPYKSFRTKPFHQKKGKNLSPEKRRFSVISAAKKCAKKILSVIRHFTGIDPYSPHLWIFPAVRKALEIHKQWPYDLVVSSYGPPASHVIGAILKKKLPVYWVADYRDLWYGNYFYSGKWPFTCLEYLIEYFFVKKADFITTVSDPLKDSLTSLFGNKVATIENGFDDEDLDKIGTAGVFPDDGKIRLVYTGRIYAGKQDYLQLLKALTILKSRGIPLQEKVEVVFYGFLLEPIQLMVTKYNLENSIVMRGFVDRKISLQPQRDADALIFFDWQDPTAKGMLTGKFFEYMFSGTPILNISLSYDTNISKLVKEAGIGITFVKSAEKLADAIETMIHGGKLPYHPSQEVLLRFTRRHLAEKMIKEINARLPASSNSSTE
ncbi:MAG: glycosyltransferase [Planctomycetes bacterium]|nr:glycosyltransferase [Planctomycetota bacterium]